jgi:glyoxylase-like metal-dependent hydrolase (beta-lactamase superfamily II)
MRAICIRGENASALTGSGTNTWLLCGPEPTLIDAAPATDPDGYTQRIADALAEEQPGSALRHVLVTHAHSDHIGGVEAIRRRWPQATFSKLPDPQRDAKYPVDWKPIADEAVIRAGDGVLWAIHTPGHAPDHLCYFEPRSSTLFCGDLLLNGGTVMIPVSAGGDLARYMHSLKRVLDLQARRALAGHGDPIENPGALIRAYIGHRLMREQQILDVLGKGPINVEGIVRRVYQTLQPELEKAAAENVLAHLLKLRGEGRAKENVEASLWSLPASL